MMAEPLAGRPCHRPHDLQELVRMSSPAGDARLDALTPPAPELPQVQLGRRGYRRLLAEGRVIHPGLRIGRPGRSRAYWPTIAGMRLLRVRLAVTFTGKEHVAPGPVIIVSNHLSGIDPVAVVMSAWWRITAFTKAEFFAARGSFFFRWMGQIPLKRGDEASTRWAMQASQHALAYGGMVAVYPEGTRSPDGRLHRLHKRVLVPLLQANPDVPVHIITMAYRPHRFPRRTRVTARISAPVALDARRDSPQQLTDTVRAAMQELSGQSYVDEYARDVKKRMRAG